ncbi:MAG: protein-disulfide reductase DsbD N-terminal domain-containing protein [Edaphobacter sp.]|uniref:protein-disulfide reductase DsbD N-terminal domain-containing protein n=1 Tax=Edaphobacter sp. TaxID=1934404 RepID=UPI0023A61C97|nr:protein-disulfide reductase DsbD N-terminal domain-containing protein [Edaphobacter sp.]MDE1175000.1 protein-disulfide reductase DsbD N-terminal domain-containing protein [Edaphobacter sp.]
MRSMVMVGVLLGVSTASFAQLGGLNGPAVKPKQYIAYTAEEQAVQAGKKSTIELIFKVAEGYHVNSHTPKSELLIPTNLTLKPVQGVTTAVPEYPAGISYSFSFEPNEKLDVYTGTFKVKVPVVATAGTHTVEATLRYQACDHAACYPPKSLPIAIAVTAK